MTRHAGLWSVLDTTDLHIKDECQIFADQVRLQTTKLWSDTVLVVAVACWHQSNINSVESLPLPLTAQQEADINNQIEILTHQETFLGSQVRIIIHLLKLLNYQQITFILSLETKNLV